MGISDLDRCFAHHMIFLPLAQRIRYLKQEERLQDPDFKRIRRKQQMRRLMSAGILAEPKLEMLYSKLPDANGNVTRSY
jgi:hypothetical protein